MNSHIAWIAGQWGLSNQLNIPLKDRGLNLGDGIFETILILDGEPKLLEAHINRFQKSAVLLGMAMPPKKAWVTSLIQEAINRIGLHQKNGALRINWSRGNAEQRGIDIHNSSPDSSGHRFWLELNTFEPNFKPLKALISCSEKRNQNSVISYCKTFGYAQAIQAKREAQLAGFDEALLLNTNNELCSGTTANVVIRRKGVWLTPHLESGCLAGIMRQQVINSGLIKEAILQAQPEEDDQWLLVNSLSCHPIIALNKQRLSPYTNAKYFWLSLLNQNQK